MKQILVGFGTVVALSLAMSGSASARTKVHHYTPFDSAGEVKAGLRVVHRSGTCDQPSFVDSRRHDAWRCFTGNFIRDPCFESPAISDQVVCVTAPWSRKAIVVSTALPSTRRGESRSSAPWALKLAQRRCIFLSGGTNAIGRKRLNYACGRKGPVLYGVPDHRTSTWTISLASNFTSQRLRRVRVRAAWR